MTPSNVKQHPGSSAPTAPGPPVSGVVCGASVALHGTSAEQMDVQGRLRDPFFLAGRPRSDTVRDPREGPPCPVPRTRPGLRPGHARRFRRPTSGYGAARAGSADRDSLVCSHCSRGRLSGSRTGDSFPGQTTGKTIGRPIDSSDPAAETGGVAVGPIEWAGEDRDRVGFGGGWPAHFGRSGEAGWGTSVILLRWRVDQHSGRCRALRPPFTRAVSARFSPTPPIG